MIDFCFDDVISSPTLGYPNLARAGLAPEEFDTTWPRVLPLRLLMYLRNFAIPFSVRSVAEAVNGSWYPVALGWHDFDCDYFALMSPALHQRLRNSTVRVLFYYHEGDNPLKIQQHLDALVCRHNLPLDCYLFVSANTGANSLDRSIYFPDHDYFFRYINQRQPQPMPCDTAPTRDFTALVRTHKWWRATVMADLWRHGLLTNSFWSYQTLCHINDDIRDNPLRPTDADWNNDFLAFQAMLPAYCDGSDQEAHNDHRSVNIDLYRHSRCHVVIETMFDVDGSGGAFLTEKTYKCIKFGQPFVIAGGPGSLQALRDQGYRVFDNAIDNRYDLISDNNLRWQALLNAIAEIKSQSAQQWWSRCRDDVIHNQHQFQNKIDAGLEALVMRLTNTL